MLKRPRAGAPAVATDPSEGAVVVGRQWRVVVIRVAVGAALVPYGVLAAADLLPGDTTFTMYGSALMWRLMNAVLVVGAILTCAWQLIDLASRRPVLILDGRGLRIRRFVRFRTIPTSDLTSVEVIDVPYLRRASASIVSQGAVHSPCMLDPTALGEVVERLRALGVPAPAHPFRRRGFGDPKMRGGRPNPRAKA